jgi:hypothetical protein
VSAGSAFVLVYEAILGMLGVKSVRFMLKASLEGVAIGVYRVVSCVV